MQVNLENILEYIKERRDMCWEIRNKAYRRDLYNLGDEYSAKYMELEVLILDLKEKFGEQ